MKKEYVDWEIDTIIDRLRQIAIEKGEQLNRLRREHEFDPIGDAHTVTLEWKTLEIIQQLQAQLLAAESAVSRESVQVPVFPKMPLPQEILKRSRDPNRPRRPPRVENPNDLVRPADINNIETSLLPER